MARRELRITPHLWMYLQYDDAGKITCVEDHDWRAGSALPQPADGDYERQFIETAMSRGVTEEQAKAFLESKELVVNL